MVTKLTVHLADTGTPPGSGYLIINFLNSIPSGGFDEKQALLPQRNQKVIKQIIGTPYRAGTKPMRRARSKKKEEVTYVVEGQCNLDVRNRWEDAVKVARLYRWYSEQGTRYKDDDNLPYDTIVLRDVTLEDQGGKKAEIRFKYIVKMEEVKDIKGPGSVQPP